MTVAHETESAADRLYRALRMSGIDYGSTYRTDTLRSWAGIPKGTEDDGLRWMACLAEVRQRLEEDDQVWLRSGGCGSYTVVAVQDLARTAIKDAWNGHIRVVEKTMRHLECAPRHLMTAAQLAELNTAEARAKGIAAAIRRARKRFKLE
jgi:hypothetical protein